MYPLPVSFPRASSNAAFISLAVTSCPASAAFSKRSRISFSCASVNARRCDVYLFRISSSNPCSLYRLQIRLTLTRLIPVAFAASSVVFPSYRIMSTRKRRLTFLSRVFLCLFYRFILCLCYLESLHLSSPTPLYHSLLDLSISYLGIVSDASLGCVSKSWKMQFRANQAAVQGDFPQACWRQVKGNQRRNAAQDAENAWSGF